MNRIEDFFKSIHSSTFDKQYGGNFLATYADENLVAASFSSQHSRADSLAAECRSPDAINCLIFLKKNKKVFRKKLRRENISFNLILNSSNNSQVPDHA